MENLPPLPTFIDNTLKVIKTYDFEVESEGVKITRQFNVTMDVTFDIDSKEILVDVIQEHIDIV